MLDNVVVEVRVRLSGVDSSTEALDIKYTTAEKEFPAKYTNAKGCITFEAVLKLNGPDLIELLKQQGYEFKEESNIWVNPENQDLLQITMLDNSKGSASLKDYETATHPGDMAKGQILIRTYNYDLSKITEEMYADIRENMAPSLLLQDTKYLAFGLENWSVVMDSNEKKYLLKIGVYDTHAVVIRLETDEWLGNIDEIYH